MTDIANKVEIEPIVRQADNVSGPPQGQWTYADYAAIPEDGNRYEVIEGVLYSMPAPGIVHQESNAWFVHYLLLYVRIPGLGRVLPAPCGVELGPKNVVQPDVVVVMRANNEIISETRVDGTPDLVVEIISPGTAKYDRNQKQKAYAKAGVKEFWIADPKKETVEVLILEQDKYCSLGTFQDEDLLPSQVVKNLPVQVKQFFL